MLRCTPSRNTKIYPYFKLKMLIPWVLAKHMQFLLSFHWPFFEICGLHMPFQKDKLIVHKASDRFIERKKYFVQSVWCEKDNCLRYFLNRLYLRYNSIIQENVRELAWQRLKSLALHLCSFANIPHCVNLP